MLFHLARSQQTYHSSSLSKRSYFMKVANPRKFSSAKPDQY